MARPPKFDAANPSGRGGPVQLPAEGRKGPAPKWPLEERMRKGELRLWRDLWATPQAVHWERCGWTRVVARYVRILIQAEETLATPLLVEARHLEDSLGLTPKAMRLMLWTIVGDAVQAKREERRAVTSAESVRARIAAVD